MDDYTKRVAVKTVLLAQLFIESLDDLRDTTLFKQSTKSLVNRLDRELTPMVKEHYDRMYSDEVAEGVNVLDEILDEIVHNAVVKVQEVKGYNLYILKDGKGRKMTIKSSLSKEEFEKEYKIKMKI